MDNQHLASEALDAYWDAVDHSCNKDMPKHLWHSSPRIPLGRAQELLIIDQYIEDKEFSEVRNSTPGLVGKIPDNPKNTPSILLEHAVTINGVRWALGGDLDHVNNKEDFKKCSSMLERSMLLVLMENEIIPWPKPSKINDEKWYAFTLEVLGDTSRSIKPDNDEIINSYLTWWGKKLRAKADRLGLLNKAGKPKEALNHE